MGNYKTKLVNIKAFTFDVDGVFTDGGVIATENGDLIRVHDSKDGFGLRMAVLKGYKTAIITGGTSESIRKRFLGIGVKEEDIYLRSRDKVPDFYDFCKRHSLKPEEVAFVGDDLPCGLPGRRGCRGEGGMRLHFALQRRKRLRKRLDRTGSENSGQMGLRPCRLFRLTA